MADPIIILTTFPDQASAVRMAQILVRERLAACVNIQAQMTSVYLWKGEECLGTEHLLMIKTRRARYESIEQRLRAEHPYELPEIIATPITLGLAEYIDWIDESTA